MMRKSSIQSQDPVAYTVGTVVRTSQSDDDWTIAQALAILERRNASGPVMGSPDDVRNYLRLRLAPLGYEVFGVLFLNVQHGVIKFEEMFRGTLTQTAVYPREVVKMALALNAGAVILSHNHPSGMPEPSRADEFLTQSLKSALALVDVRVLDHIVVASGGTVSMAERGLI